MFLRLLSLLTALFVPPLAAAERIVYVSSGGKLQVFNVDGSTGELSTLQESAKGGLVAISPDKSKLYTYGKSIFSYEILPDGKLELLGAYKIDGETGELERVQQIDVEGKPHWVMRLTLE